jgi:hypothetical protein
MRFFDYTPGRGAVVAAWPLCLLLDAPPSDPLVATVLAQAEENLDLESALRMWDHLPDGRPGLAGLQVLAGTVTVAAAGTGLVRIGSDDLLIGRDGLARRSCPVGDPVQLVLPDLSREKPAPLPLRWGVAAAGTVDLAAVTDQIDEVGPVSYAPLVEGLICPRGHPNPVGETRCRVCGRSLKDAPTQTVARPSLGVLKVSSGARVPLDRGAIFGRNPQAAPGQSPAPNLVRILDPDKDVSGRHAEVRLDGWQVEVIDLGSTNGTQVIAPHGRPIALEPNVAVVITPGTRVVLANAFDFVYEL